jgi:homoprotocatechuate degradation regulator HpaR
MMLYQTLDAVMPRFRRIFNDFGLTEQHWRVLRVLWETDHTTIMALSEATLLPAPSLIGIVDRLERDELVNRQRSEVDRRKVNVVLTSQGAALEGEIMPRVASAYAELKQSVDAETWSAVLAGLGQISIQGRVESSE